MKIITNDSSTDDQLGEVFKGYVVGIHTDPASTEATDIYVTDVGRNSAGFVTLEGFLFDPDANVIAAPYHPHQPRTFALIDIDRLEIY